MKRFIITITLLVALVGMAHSVEWSHVIDNREWVTITNVDKNINYVNGGCSYIFEKYEDGTLSWDLKVSAFSSPTTHYIQIVDCITHTVERKYFDDYASWKRFIFQLQKNNKVLDKGFDEGWEIIEK